MTYVMHSEHNYGHHHIHYNVALASGYEKGAVYQAILYDSWHAARQSGFFKSADPYLIQQINLTPTSPL